MAKFYKCAHCNNIFATVEDGKVVPQCCGEDMVLLEAGSVDAAVEKHVPVLSVERGGHVIRVNVGEVDHPMEEAHYITWIALETKNRLEIHHLNPGEAPSTFFAGDGSAATVYAYCNLHGLWKAEL